jgi:predicted metalloprotease with PDZ domain
MRSFVFLFITVLSFHKILAQQPIIYQLDLSNINHHELRVTVSISDLDDQELRFRMPNTSPGRYAIHSFAKNVYDVSAIDENGKALLVEKVTPYEWQVYLESKTIHFQYTVYGNHADGTYLGVDSRKLHINMPATFPYAVGLDFRKINLIIPEYKNWIAATQLQSVNDSTFLAPDYAYFYDSPTIYGEMDTRLWEVDGQQIKMAVMHTGNDEELDHYMDWTKLIVNEERDIFGELPNFDFGEYTFLMTYNPYVNSDGMEHRNSTVCSSMGNLRNHADKLIGTVSHEFFHAWNIERIRPEDLEPFDFDKANMTDALWFGEGFTNYYQDLVLVRTGIISPETYIRSLINTLNYVMNSPARSFRGPAAMSEFATFTDAGTANDETNFENVFVSYYSYGEIIALGLDLTLRLEYRKTLDDFMRLVWEKFGKPETPYQLVDLKTLLAELTGDPVFADRFFKEQIYGSELPDFKTLFGEFGIKMSLQNPLSAYFNNPRVDKGIVSSNLIRGTALYEAGMEKGDKLISIDGTEINSTARLNSVINRLEIGKTYSITYSQLGETVNSQFTTKQDPRVILTYLSSENIKKSELKRRNDWLGLE